MMLAGSVRKEASSERSVSWFSAARSLARRLEQPRHGTLGPSLYLLLESKTRSGEPKRIRFGAEVLVYA
jgi:hypothetical protein